MIVAAIGRAVSGVAGASLLDTTSDQDHNRSVLTFAGTPEAVSDAAFMAVREAAGKIDLSRHAGVHPRLGAADVIPLVPVEGITLEQCATLARTLGERIWNELGVPVYLYEAAALRPECKRLENVRKLAPTGLAPDFGTGRHPTAGASVVGARKFLIAWNINLRYGGSQSRARDCAGNSRVFGRIACGQGDRASAGIARAGPGLDQSGGFRAHSALRSFRRSERKMRRPWN